MQTIKITKKLSFEEFSNSVKILDRNKAINTLEKRLLRYEQQYNIKSRTFYKKYIQGDLEDSLDFYTWADKIETYCRLLGIKPAKIKVGDST